MPSHPVLLSAADAATYAGVLPGHPAGLAAPVRAHAVGDGRGNLYDLEELAAILARRTREVARATVRGWSATR